MTTYADAEPIQLSMFDDPLFVKFMEFHHANPKVYAAICRLARQRKAAGHDRGAIAQIFEVLRWQDEVVTRTRDGLKLNNNHRAHYARLIQLNEPDLAGFFETRITHSDKENAA